MCVRLCLVVACVANCDCVRLFVLCSFMLIRLCVWLRVQVYVCALSLVLCLFMRVFARLRCFDCLFVCCSYVFAPCVIFFVSWGCLIHDVIGRVCFCVRALD